MAINIYQFELIYHQRQIPFLKWFDVTARPVHETCFQQDCVVEITEEPPVTISKMMNRS